MKVVHICTIDSGGAGLCCLRIHNSLLKQGIDSHVLVLEKKSDDPKVIGYGKKRYKIWRIVNKVFRILHIDVTDFNKVFLLSQESACYTTPTSIIDVSRHPLVQSADVIHLHWVNRFVDYPSFFRKVQKPIVWTLHDENLFLGIAHYQNAVIKDSPLEEKYYRVKYNSIKEIKNLGIVFLSQMMYQQYVGHEMISNASKCIINNSVDCNLFKPIKKIEARKYYNISPNAKVFLFVAATITDKRKGFSFLLEALKNIKEPDTLILAVGRHKSDIDLPNVILTGEINDVQSLSRAYSCADYFVMPSMQEAFAQIPLEAMACGLPCIVFPVSGTEELITSINGVRCNGFTTDDLVEGIEKAFDSTYDGNLIREYTMNNFSPESIADKYAIFYDKMMSENLIYGKEIEVT